MTYYTQQPSTLIYIKKKTHRNKKMSSKRNVEKYMTKLFAHKHKI